jgi:aminopeptidase
MAPVVIDNRRIAMVQVSGRRPGLQRAVENVVLGCLRVRVGEELLVVCDIDTQLLGERLREVGRAAGAEVVLASMDGRASHGEEPPSTVAAAMLRCDAYLAATKRSLGHTRARQLASEAGARGATLPGITAPMLGRLMSCDLEALASRSRSIASLLGAAAQARVTCPRGSDMTFDLRGRDASADDGDLSRPAAFGNLPCGEAFIAPLSGHGELAVTSIASFGVSEPPARLTIRDGSLIDAEGSLGRDLLDALLAHGRAGCNLAELGVGTNDRAMLSGNVLEDEKLLGSVHVAFGASAAIGGGVAVPIHLDAVVIDASLWLDGEQVLDAGRLTLAG